MKAAYLKGLRQVAVEEAAEPELHRETDVLLQVESVGVCGSDMHYYRTGRIGDQVVEYPFVVGHEFSARVLEVGPGVGSVRPGERVAVDPLIWCGRCDQCLAGREHTCRDQVFMGCPGQLSGCLVERVVMPEACCFPVPDALDADAAAMVEPMSVGLYSQRLGGDVSGANVGILGCGPIGLCVLLACRAAGAANVYMTDIRNNRRNLAERLGADWTGNPDETDIVADILDREPRGLDILFECAGEQSTLDNGTDLSAPAGKLMLVGIPEADRVSFLMDSLRRREITLQPVRRQSHCVADTIDGIAAGRLDVKPMITHTFGLEDVQQAFDTVADYRDGVVKAMIHLTRS